MSQSPRSSHPIKYYLWYFTQVVIFALVYFGVAVLGLKFATINNNASPIWPASGVAISILFFCGRKYFPAIFLGAFLANYGTQIPLNTIALISLGNMLEAVFAVSLLRRFHFSSVLPSDIYTGILKYLSVALGPTAISATVGTLALFLNGTLDLRSLPANWLTWWLGDCLGFLLIFPLLHEMRKWRRGLTTTILPREDFWFYFKVILRLAFAILCVILTTHFVFAVPSGYPYLFIIFFSFLLVTHLSPPWGIYLAAIYVSILSIFKTNEGLGPFWSGIRNDSIIHLEFFLGAVWITAIVLCSLKKTHTLKRPSWAFSVGWLLTGATFYAFFQANIQEARIYYEGKAREAATIVEETMNGYTRLLESGVGLLKIDPHMSVQKWKTYTNNLRLVEKYPGLKGMGVIYRVPRSSQAEFLKKTRQEIANFSIHDVPNELQSPDESYVITYLEPLESNRPAVGLDISTEAHRLEALLRARDSGEAALTQPIRLKQSPGAGTGYLLLVPFYTGDPAPITVEERRKKIAGFVYAPIEAGAFFDAATKVYASDLRWLNPENLESHKEHLIYTEMDLVDNKETIAWEPTSKAKVLSNVEASMAGFSGAFVTVVLAILVAGLENISFQAQKLADKKTEEVEERERLWRALAEMSPIGIFQTDSVGRINYANRRWASIFDSDPSSFRSDWFGPVHPQDRQQLLAAWKAYNECGGNEFNYRYRIKIGSTEKYLSSTIVDMRSDKGILIGYLGTVQDVTDLHLNQLALATASRLSSLGQMAGGIAHEINTPLSVISVNAELLKSQVKANNQDPQKLLGGLEKIQGTVHRIARIIKGLRSLSRDSGEGPMIEFPVAKIIEDTVDLCEKRFTHHGVLLNLPDLNRPDLLVQGYPDQGVQVLLNLLNNAFDAVADQKGGWVKIFFEETSQEDLRILVQDSGLGIPEEVVEHLFNPFFTTKEVGKGTGLGLSISRALMEKMGGKLYLDSSRDHTTFVIQFKRALTNPLGMSPTDKV